jgi:Bacterial regulatory proteins, tetR family
MTSPFVLSGQRLCCHLHKGALSNGSLIRSSNRISDPHIRITDPIIKATHASRRKKNYSHILAVARDVVAEHGADASMRDIARRAEVGLATLFRHFPTREALFEALLHMNVDALTQQAAELETSSPPDEALVSWFREAVAFTS